MTRGFPSNVDPISARSADSILNQLTNKTVTPITPFVCDCADSKVRFPDWHFDEIRKDVCQGLPFYKQADGKQYCVLHYPSKDKAEHFEKVFQQRIAQGKWDFRMVWFPSKLDFENQTLTHHIQFSSATFAGRVNFKECVFDARLDCFDSKFLDEAEFLYSTFVKSTNFNSAEFHEYGDFAFARFKEGARASFDKASFRRASFQGTHFYSEVNFSGTKVSEYANFLQVQCFAAAKFNKVIFPQSGETSFCDAEFHRGISFDNSEFGPSDFKRAKFSFVEASLFDKPSFKEARFKAITQFADAIFRAEADFTQASFQSVAFERATFARGVRFTGCDFFSNVYFHETKFGGRENNRITSGHAHFEYALFEEKSKVYFQNSWFSWFVNFDYANLRGYIFFKGSEDFPLFDSVLEPQTAEFGPLLSFVNTVIEQPDRVYFHTVRLRPYWFVSVDSRKFNLTNIDWFDERGHLITAEGELESLRKRNYKRAEQLLATAFRQLAANADDNTRLEEASFFRRLAMETEWIERRKKFSQLYAHVREQIKKQKVLSGTAQGYTPTPPASLFAVLRKSGDFILHLLYRLSSFYGENWGRATGVLVLILILFAGLFRSVQFYVCPADKPITQSSQQNLCQTRRLNNYEAVRHSLTTATFQTVDYRKPITGTGETLTVFEKIFAPLQAALLALAIRRRFMR